jgi:DNA-binding transcriptional regulator YiaG
MPNIGSVLKDEILRLARKEMKSNLEALKKSSTAYRREIAELKRQVAQLSRAHVKQEKQLARSAPAADTSEETGGSVRFSAKGLKTLRARLDLSAEAFGRLAGVSGQSVYNWERGTTTPRREQVQALAALRGLGKREALARLEAQN